MSAIVLIVQRMFEHSLALPFFEIEAFYHYLSEGRQNENHNHRKLTKLITWTTVLSNSMKIMSLAFCFIDYAKAFDCVDHNKLWKNLKKDGNTRPPDLPLEKSVCRSGSNS